MMLPEFKQDIFLSLGRAYAAAGKKYLAISSYENMLREFPNPGSRSYMANIKLAELKGEAVAFPAGSAKSIAFGAVPTEAVSRSEPETNQAETQDSAKPEAEVSSEDAQTPGNDPEGGSGDNSQEAGGSEVQPENHEAESSN